LGFVAASDPVVRAAWGAGLLSVALSAALVLQVLRMRRRLGRRARRREAVFAAWRPILFEAIAGGEPSLPPLAARDEDAFLLLWVQVQDGLRGEALRRLAALGEAVGAHALARRRIGGGDALGRILALRTFGYLGRAEDWGVVLRWLDDPRAYLSLAAARALVRLDADRAAGEILGRLAARLDWPVPLFASILADASAPRLSSRLAALCRDLPAPALVRLLPLATLVEEPVVDAILAGLLERASEDPDVLSAALRHVRSPAHLPAVRRAAEHERWSVRVQAAAALGRVGEPGDRDLLVGMLKDREWWVRYRAAQALAARPLATPEEMVAFAEHLGDRFARDIVAQALAEARA
jgi:HEAT repeat protein